MSRDRDAALVEASLGGDTRAFGTLMDKYEKKLFNTALRILGDEEDAMDATQNAFVKVYEKLDRFDSSYRFFSWIYRILLNESYNVLNHRKRFDKLDSGIIQASSNPEEAYSDVEAGAMIEEAVMALKPDYRVVVVLKHFQGMSYREMSDVVGIPEKTIKSRLFEARRQLKEILLRKGISR